MKSKLTPKKAARQEPSYISPRSELVSSPQPQHFRSLDATRQEKLIAEMVRNKEYRHRLIEQAITVVNIKRKAINVVPLERNLRKRHGRIMSGDLLEKEVNLSLFQCCNNCLEAGDTPNSKESIIDFMADWTTAFTRVSPNA